MPETATTATPDRPQRRRAASPFMAPTGAPVRPAKAALNYLAVCVAVIAVVWASLAAAGISLNFDFVAQYRVRIWDGFCMTVGISAASLVVSLALGVLVAAGQGARFLPLRYLCDFYVKIIRGTPLIVQVYFFYYIIGTAWGIDNRVLAGIIILSLFSGAYIAEIVRGSLLSLDAGQMEAARGRRLHPRPNLALRGGAAAGGAHAAGTYGAGGLHYQGLVAAVSHRRHRADPDHARDHRHELQLLRRVSAARRIVSGAHAAHHGGKPPLREEAGLCALEPTPPLASYPIDAFSAQPRTAC